jgi:hypothetical protein
MTQLRVCDGCSRHVFVTEKACPFCDAALQEAPKRSLGQVLRAGMSRAQILAVAAAVTGQTLGACTDTPNNTGVSGVGGTTAGAMSGGSGGTAGGGAGGAGGMSGGASGTGGAGGASGASGAGGAGGTAGTSGAGGTGGAGGEIVMPLYGGAMPPDDAGAEDSGEPMAVPVYSAPNPRD